MIGSTRVSVKRATVACTARSSSLSSERISNRSNGFSDMASRQVAVEQAPIVVVVPEGAKGQRHDAVVAPQHPGGEHAATPLSSSAI